VASSSAAAPPGAWASDRRALRSRGTISSIAAFRQGGGLAGEQVAAAASCVENGATDAGSDDEPALAQDGQVLADRSGGQRHAVSELRGVADQFPAGVRRPCSRGRASCRTGLLTRSLTPTGRDALIRAGFERASVRVETVTVPWHLPTADLLFEAELRAGVRTGAILRAQLPERLEKIRAAIGNAVARYAADGGFTLPIAARLISAQATAG
jgi:hypothetical protein